MSGVRYEFRVSALMSDRARDAFGDMIVQSVPPESIVYADVVDEAHLRDLLACAAHSAWSWSPSSSCPRPAVL